MFVTDVKTQKFEPDPKKENMTDKSFRGSVNMIDTPWGRIYFLKCENFGQEFRTHCAKTLSLEYTTYSNC